MLVYPSEKSVNSKWHNVNLKWQWNSQHWHLLMIKSLQTIRMDHHRVNWEEIPTNVHHQFLTCMGKKKKTLFQTLWLSNIWCLKFLYPHFIFCAPNFTDQDVQKTPVKNFSGHTALPEMAFQNIVRNGTNDSNQYFLLFPSCFIPHQNQILSFESHLNCCLQIILIWTSLKF